MTVCLLLVRPEPRHSAHGVFTIDFLPPQRRQVLRIIYEPVLMDSCRGAADRSVILGYRSKEGEIFYSIKGRKLTMPVPLQ